MPWKDWQFWVVTVLAAIGAWVVVRPFLPRRRAGGAGCPTCAPGSGSRRRKTPLTISGRRV